MDPLAPFDGEVIEAVAAETGRDPAAVRELVARHQRAVRENPGVADLVYEWRRYLPYDPLVARADDAYHLVVLPRVWEDFGRAGFSERELDRLGRVHDRQARRAARARGDDESVFDGGAPVVLARD